MKINSIMKAIYVNPVTEVMNVQAYAILQGVSGGNSGLMDGGQAPSTPGQTIDPQ